MPLTVERLEADVDNAASMCNLEAALESLSDVLATLSSREELGASFLRGQGESAARDYLGICSAFQRLVEKDAKWANDAGDRIREATLCVLPRPPRRATCPFEEISCTGSTGAALSVSGGDLTEAEADMEDEDTVRYYIVDEEVEVLEEAEVEAVEEGSGDEEFEGENELRPHGGCGGPAAAGSADGDAARNQDIEDSNQVDAFGSAPARGRTRSEVTTATPSEYSPPQRCTGETSSQAATGGETSPSPIEADSPEESQAVIAAAPLLDVAFQQEVEPDDSSPAAWVAVLMAALLPLLADALPREHNGVCIIPHPHTMEQQEAREVSVYLGGGSRPVFRTNKICDNCGSRITDRFFFHCSANCDIDFCSDCHTKSQGLLSTFLERAGVSDDAEGKQSMYRRLFWVIDITERVGGYVLHLSAARRESLAQELAFEWPTLLFERLIQAAIDVVNAKVVHVQDVKDIRSDEGFWYAVGWLQFLYCTNSLPCRTRRLDEAGARGPKVEYERFILEGINKCEPMSEYRRWQKHPSAKVPDVVAMEWFGLTADFCSFLTHSNLVPVSFRRACLLFDVWEQIQCLDEGGGRVFPLTLEVPREPRALIEAVLARFQDKEDGELRRPLRVTFSGEEAVGPGVTKEFFQVALRAFLEGSKGDQGSGKDAGAVHLQDVEEGEAAPDYSIAGLQHQAAAPLCLFRCAEGRSFWFCEELQEAVPSEAYRAYRACGILLGQAVLNSVLVPNSFPTVLYERLLQDLGSPCARPLALEDLATVNEEIARSLRLVLDYTGEDIGTVFGDLGWQRTGRLPPEAQLTQANKAEFVQAYVDWFFRERISAQFEPLSSGFRAVLGNSDLLRNMVDSVQLVRIVCGGVFPVDISAIRRGAAHEGWTPEEESEYLPAFWEVLEKDLNDSERMHFVVFVSASDRVPLRGWQDLGLVVQRNGTGDDRLPAAYTCFCQFLLPRYSSREQLRDKLRSAIANSEGFGLR